MRTFLTGLLIAGSLGILSGCGGSSNSALSYSAFSTAANTICKTGNGQANALGAKLTAKATPANAAIIQKEITLDTTAEAKLKALKGPAALQTARNTLVTEADTEIAAIKKVQAAAQSGNQSAYVAGAKALGPLGSQASLDGSKLGAPACATG